jgi:hypothetical protein
MNLHISRVQVLIKNVSVQEHRALKNRVFDVAMITILTALPVLSRSKMSFPFVG